MLGEQDQNYYEILDIKPDANQTEIRNAYFRIKSAYSKDSAALYSIFDEQETRLVLEQIEQAYLVLSNEEKRKEYDKHHGLLSSDSLASSKENRSDENIYNFAQSAENKTNPAHEAAANVLAGDSLFDDSKEKNQVSKIASSRDFINSFQENPRPVIKDTTDYSTPRTLNDSQFQSNDSAFNQTTVEKDSHTFENKLGIVKRIDIVKPAISKSPEIDSLIQNETDFRGSFLKKIREIRGISLDQLSDFTKISKSYLNLIENEEFKALPAPVYVRGFILQVAKALKIPSDKAATGYMNFYKSTVNPPP